MKRNIEAHLEMQIETAANENKIMPIFWGYSVLVDEKELPFSFRASNTELIRLANIVTITTKQDNLKIKDLFESCVENDFIHQDTPEEDIQKIFFDLIKKAGSISNMDIVVYEEYGCLIKEKIKLTAFTIVDTISGEVINLLEKLIMPDAFPNVVDIVMS